MDQITPKRIFVQEFKPDLGSFEVHSSRLTLSEAYFQLENLIRENISSKILFFREFMSKREESTITLIFNDFLHAHPSVIGYSAPGCCVITPHLKL